MGRRHDRKTSGRSTQTVRTERPGRPRKPRVCVFCERRTAWVDYKDVGTLRGLMSDRGKIKARRVTGTCRQHQRDVAMAIKLARELALLPYVLVPPVGAKARRGGPGRPRGDAPRGERPSTPDASADGAPPVAPAAVAEGP